MKAILIDDEQDARDSLRNMLAVCGHPVSIIGEAADGAKGLLLIRELKPDLVFLDVEMPDKNGFQVLEELGSIDFALIFVTAYNQYAVRSFEFSAVSYLLKPVDKAKLLAAVLKAQEFRRLQQIDEQHKLLLEIVKKQETKAPFNHRLCFSNQKEINFVYFKDLIRIEADGNCSFIYAVGQVDKIFVSKNIGEYLSLFKDVPFLFQTHRGHLINLYHAKKIMKGDESGVLMRSHNGSEDVLVPVTPRLKDELLERLKVI